MADCHLDAIPATPVNPPSNHGHIAEIHRYIREADGRVSADELNAEYNLSKQHLEDVCINLYNDGYLAQFQPTFDEDGYPRPDGYREWDIVPPTKVLRQLKLHG